MSEGSAQQAGTPQPHGAAQTNGFAPPPGLSVRAAVAKRGVHLGVTARPGRVLAVLGANGAGKSTLVNLISGLLRPTSGTVALGETLLASDEVWVPPHERRIGLMSQDDLLFPHLNALENVAFGPRARGVRATDAREIARARLVDVDADRFATRRPAQLSGGQRRRVALARALAADPQVVLLDEPLAALDVDVAARMRRLLAAQVRDGRHTVVLVTHDLLDVLALADDVVVLDGGRVVEHGPTLTVLQRPRSAFLARLAGLVLLAGTVTGSDGQFATLDIGGAALTGRLREPGVTTGRVGLVSFRPAAVSLYPAGANIAGSPRNVLDLTVISLEPLGGTVRVRGVLDAAGRGGPGGPGGPADGTPALAYRGTTDAPVIAADVTPAAAAELGLAEGSRVRAALKATEVDVDPRPQGAM